jgi:hypothetical protein
MLLKEIVNSWRDEQTHGRWTTDNGPSQRLTLNTLLSGELKFREKIGIVTLVVLSKYESFPK